MPPVIPSEYVGNNAFPDRPPQAEINPESYGRDAAALERVGGEIGDIGSRLLQARKHAMESDMVNNAETADSQWLQKHVEDLRQSFAKTKPDGSPIINPDGSVAYDPTGFADALKGGMDQRINDNLNSMPTGDAQRLYRERTQHMFNSAYAGAYDWENQTRVSSMMNNMETRARTHGNLILNSASPFKDTVDELNRIRQEGNDASGPPSGVEGERDHGIMSPHEADKFVNAKSRTAIDTMFASYMKSPGMAADGLQKINDIVSGKDEDSKRMAGLVDLRDLETYQSKLKAVVKKGYAESVKSFEARYKDTVSAYNSSDPKISGMINTQDTHELALQALSLTPVKGKQWAQEHVMGLVVGNAYKNAKESIADMPESDKSVFKARMNEEYNAGLRGLGIDPDHAYGLGLGALSEQSKRYDDLWKKATHDRHTDLGKYIEDTNGNLPGSINNGIPDSTRLDARASVARSLHIYNGSLLKNDERASITNELKSAAANDPSSAANRLGELSASWGDHSHKVMAELTGQKGGLPHYFMEAMNASSSDVAKDIIDLSGKNGDMIEKEAKADKSIKDIEVAVKKEWAGPEKVISAVGTTAHNGSISDQMRNTVLRKAIIYNRQGQSPEDAAKNAADDIFHRDYHILDGTAYMPRMIGGQPTRPDVINGAMQAIHSAPRDGFKLPFNSIGLNAEEKDARLASGIDKGHWVTDNSKDRDNPQPETRAIFMIPQTTGGHTQWAPLLRADGSKVSIDYAKESLNPSPEALNNARRFWQQKIGADGLPEPKNPDPQLFAPDLAPEAPPEVEPGLQEQNISPDKIVPAKNPGDSGRSPQSTAGLGEDENGMPTNLLQVSGDPTSVEESNPNAGGPLPQDVRDVGAEKSHLKEALAPMTEAQKSAVAARIEKKGFDIKHVMEMGSGIVAGDTTSGTSFGSDGEVRDAHINPPLSQGEYKSYAPFVFSGAKQYGIDPQILSNQIRVESNYKPNAKGPVTIPGKENSRAIGIAQFFKAAAADTHILFVGMQNGKWVDERRDPSKAIPAMAKYLSMQLKTFGDDYGKALAAYNAGAETVKTSVRQHGRDWLEHMADYKLGKGAEDYVNKVLER